MAKKLIQTVLTFFLTVTLISCGSSDGGGEEETELGSLYVSSNTSALIGVLDVSNLSSVEVSSFGIAASDADGIYYSSEQDIVVQANRTDNRVDVYTNISTSLIDANLTLGASSTSDFSNPRKIAVSGNKVVVAQDASEANNQTNAFAVYTYSATSVTLDRSMTTTINVWDIQFDSNDMYAIVDNSDSLAVFADFLSETGSSVSPTKTVAIKGIVRTHALYYDIESDIMFMTDIGDANSDSDGAIQVIQDFSSKFAAASDGGEISASEQIRIGGDNTELGNPVGITYDRGAEVIFVAERANGGGKVLAFDFPSSNGNPSPQFSLDYSGASAVYLTTESE